jgi:hypothetical protein
MGWSNLSEFPMIATLMSKVRHAYLPTGSFKKAQNLIRDFYEIIYLIFYEDDRRQE